MFSLVCSPCRASTCIGCDSSTTCWGSSLVGSRERPYKGLASFASLARRFQSLFIKEWCERYYCKKVTRLTLHVEVISSLLLEILNDPLIFICKVREWAERDDASRFFVIGIVAEATLKVQRWRLSIMFKADAVLESSWKPWLRALQGWALNLCCDQRYQCCRQETDLEASCPLRLLFQLHFQNLN